MKIVYFGTPEYAVPTLEALASDSRFEVTLVVTQPDRPAGRHHQLTPPPVKIAAERLGLQMYQPASLRNNDMRRPLEDARADFFVVAAYGRIFGEKTLAIPRKGCINLHASLLPRYRGASPIAAAILAGDAETGVSLMKMDAGLDTGPVYASVTTPIYDNDTTDVLTARLSMLGAQMVIDQLPRIANGELEAVRQSDDGASMTRPIVKSDGVVDWSVPAIHIERQVRAMWPWPRAWTMADGQQLQIHVSAVTDCDTGAVPGRFLLVGGHLMVQSGKDCVLLHKVQPAGGKPMTGAAWLAGFRGTSAQFAEVDDAAGERLLIELIS